MKPDYGPEGVETFKRDLVENEAFIGQCREVSRPIYAAFDGGKIIGIMGMRPNKTHINLVFTKKEYHHQGVASALFEFLKKDILMETPG